ncbi:MAG: Diaminopimelate epimerase [Chlamydiae bacterium]|nr:Diaminopimelate epimerase [Chlamydiota bacterium]
MMCKVLEFSKYSGCGNDFILVDNRHSHFPSEIPFIQKICARCTGVGADGVILLEESTVAEVKMTIFNADGSEAEMCGNGVRCFLKFLIQLGFPKKTTHIETKERVIEGGFIDDELSVNMGTPTDIQWNLDIEGQCIHFLNTGVPHAVHFVDDLKSIDVETTGRHIRRHNQFAPKGTNVTFVQVLGPKELLFCTYERGVEAETLACGTGAAAAAYAYGILEEIAPPVTVRTKQNDIIKIYFDPKEHILMTGPADLIYKGRLCIDMNAKIV